MMAQNCSLSTQVAGGLLQAEAKSAQQAPGQLGLRNELMLTSKNLNNRPLLEAAPSVFQNGSRQSMYCTVQCDAKRLHVYLEHDI